MLTTTTKALTNASRPDDLKRILETRRSELVREVRGKIRDVRSDGSSDRDGLDMAESSEVDIQDEIEFALIQLKTETLNRIDSALRRLEEGDYGNCSECGAEISEARLRALPFAVRCRDCEEVHEAMDRAQRRGTSPFFDLRS